MNNINPSNNLGNEFSLAKKSGARTFQQLESSDEGSQVRSNATITRTYRVAKSAKKKTDIPKSAAYVDLSGLNGGTSTPPPFEITNRKCPDSGKSEYTQYSIQSLGSIACRYPQI